MVFGGIRGSFYSLFEIFYSSMSVKKDVNCDKEIAISLKKLNNDS